MNTLSKGQTVTYTSSQSAKETNVYTGTRTMVVDSYSEEYNVYRLHQVGDKYGMAGHVIATADEITAKQSAQVISINVNQYAKVA